MKKFNTFIKLIIFSLVLSTSIIICMWIALNAKPLDERRCLSDSELYSELEFYQNIFYNLYPKDPVKERYPEYSIVLSETISQKYLYLYQNSKKSDNYTKLKAALDWINKAQLIAQQNKINYYLVEIELIKAKILLILASENIEDGYKNKAKDYLTKTDSKKDNGAIDVYQYIIAESNPIQSPNEYFTGFKNLGKSYYMLYECTNNKEDLLLSKLYYEYALKNLDKSDTPQEQKKDIDDYVHIINNIFSGKGTYEHRKVAASFPCIK